jgi:predicted metalloprotease with PDZ domain
LAFAHHQGRLSKPQFFMAFIVLVFLLIPVAVSAADSVRHTISYPKDRQQLILVRSEFPVSTPVTELIMPNWTPGSYLIRDYAANIDRISAATQDGTVLGVRKISKDHWQVDTSQASKLVVDYEVSTPSINVSTSWTSNAFTLINGASVFLYTIQTRGLPQQLNIVAGTERGEVLTAMPHAPDSGVYRADDYDELVDNPVAVARAPTYRFTLKNQDYVFANVGENEFWDGEQAARDVEKIVAETQSFWNINPLRRPYWFLNFAVEGKGGLEHDHSTVILTGRRQMRDRENYIDWLGIVAHEFFHVWNVRHMRPLELARYDYQHEQYTSQLWIAEGLTSYYDNLLMSRAGLIQPEEYMELLAKDIHRLETTPGRMLRPVTEASVDTWIRHYQPNANSVNNTISYYTKGSIIGFVMDTYLRKNSKGRHDLDEVMRKMYSLYSSKPYSSEAFAQIVVDLGGPEAGEFLQTLLTTTVEIDVDAALDWYGLKLNRGLLAQDDESSAELSASGFGVIWDEDTPGLVIKAVLAGSGGSIAGLIPGDELLAIDDERLTVDNLDSMMTSFSPGQDATLLISRRGRISSLDIKLDAAIPDRFEIVLQSSFGKRHINRLQSLLGQNLLKRP